MFREWLKNNDVRKLDYSARIFPCAADRGFWDSKYSSEYINEAEKFFGYDWPTIKATDFMAFKLEGNRLKQERPHFARRNALCTLVIAEILEYKGRFIPDIVNGLLAICEETFWGVSAHSAENITHRNIPDNRDKYMDLFAAETAALLSMTHNLLHDELFAFCHEVVERVERELEERIMIPYLHHRDFWWMGYYDRKVNNWNPWILSNIACVFLTMCRSKADLTAAVEKLIYEINCIYNVYPDDGGCDEGASYWAVSGATLFEFCELLYTATNGAINFFDDEKFRNICRYEYRAYIGNGYFTNFADGTPRPTHNMNGILYLMGERFGDEKFKAFAGELSNADNQIKLEKPEQKRDSKIRRRLYEVIYADEIASQPKFVPVEEHKLENIEVTFVRDGKWYYASKGGNNQEGHNHNDVGSFIAYYDSTPVLVDPSVGVYTKKTFSDERYDIWTMQSAWHNLPEFNGLQQHDGPEYKADSFELDGKTTKISFASAFVKEAGVKSADRIISISEDGIKVEDSFVLNGQNNTAVERFIALYDVKVNDGKVYIGDKFVLESNVPAEIILDDVHFDDDDRLKSQWMKTKLNRITFAYKCDDEFKVKFELKKL